MNGFTDWYERPLHGLLGDTEIYGTADYLVARGEKEPSCPIFFLQEFKPAFTNKSPEIQLVSEMLVALSQIDPLEIAADLVGVDAENRLDQKVMYGAYITGSIWKFVIMEKVVHRYTYYVSQSLDCLRPLDAARIYGALLFLKSKLMTYPANGTTVL